MNTEEHVLDVSELPNFAFGPRGVMWWGVLGMIVIEGTMFAMMLAAYFYLRGRVPDWPPGTKPPDLFYGLINTIVLVVSVLPNAWYKRSAERLDLQTVRIGLLISIAFAIIFCILRVFEFRTLNVHWTTNAYGSVVWTLLGLHTLHLVTDLIDTIVLTVLLFTDKFTGKHFVDVSENAFYWYFVVIAWLPIFAVIYLLPGRM